MAQLAVRLCDLRPDGSSALITMGVLNLTHRNSFEAPEPLVPGDRFETVVALDQIAYRIPAGHRLRVAVSTSYWPYIWPSPERTTVSLEAANAGVCRSVPRSCPRRTNAALRNRLVPTPWRHENHQAVPIGRRSSETDPETGVVRTVIFNDAGENRDLAHGLISGSTTREHWSIHPDDPQSAKVAYPLGAGPEAAATGATETVADMQMRCDRQLVLDLIATLSATENDGSQVFERKIWS
jgi:hypothetical protein